MILADIASGNTDWADICFLIAVILFVIGAVVAYRPVVNERPLWATMVALGLAFVSLGWLLL